ncbi:MAG: type II/IV secretion system protein [Agathobacter sp.]|nr:type II/IV secretion system protein [Agathobacter sp.]MBQ3558987.1 type II/IV secretion system protein [Agathobacter sp.]
MKYWRLGDLLVSSGVITEAQLELALKMQKEEMQGKRLGTVLIESGIITENQLIETLQMQLGVEFIDLNNTAIPPEMAQVLPKNIAKKHMVIPVKVVRNELYLAMVDPLNFITIEEVQSATRKKVIPVIATTAAMERAVLNLYSNEGAARAIEEMKKDNVGEVSFEPQKDSVAHIEDDANSAPTIRLVNSIIERAVTEQASDVHIEPREEEVMVRMRIDGMMRNVFTVPKELQSSVISRLKIMGNMDISQHRIPLDGRCNVRIRQQDIDLRISTLPTIYGEKTVLRLLKKAEGMLTMEGIGLRGENMELFQKLIHNNSEGVILIVGPTGSGKSSTMYTMVKDLNNEEVNLITLEDPVEYNINGVNQVQINEKAGLTFANALRAVLRQDPDIIGVGEIRDGETAEIALRAAMTGHLVLSTIHTNDAKSSIDRLLGIGVEPYLIAGSVKGIISQRLVRRICPRCKTAYTPDETETKALKLPSNRNYTFYRGQGCPECFYTGYRGRMAVFEILVFNSDIKRAISTNDPVALEKAIEASGFTPILENCRELVLEGVTSAKEVSRAVSRTDY